VKINTCQINDNAAGIEVGGLGNTGEARVFSTTMSGNTAADQGSAILDGGDHLTVSGCTITDNSAPLGGGIAYHNGKPRIVNGSVISGNTGGDVVQV
jgi:hypothetical protein